MSEKTTPSPDLSQFDLTSKLTGLDQPLANSTNIHWDHAVDFTINSKSWSITCDDYEIRNDHGEVIFNVVGRFRGLNSVLMEIRDDQNNLLFTMSRDYLYYTAIHWPNGQLFGSIMESGEINEHNLHFNRAFATGYGQFPFVALWTDSDHREGTIRVDSKVVGTFHPKPKDSKWAGNWKSWLGAKDRNGPPSRDQIQVHVSRNMDLGLVAFLVLALQIMPTLND